MKSNLCSCSPSNCLYSAPGHSPANIVTEDHQRGGGGGASAEEQQQQSGGSVHLIHRHELGEMPNGAVEIATIAETIDTVDEGPVGRAVLDDPVPDIMLKVPAALPGML